MAKGTIFRLLLPLLIGAMVVLTNPASQAKEVFPAAGVKLLMRQLCCDKTTENGADEVFILVYGRRSDGATFIERNPAPTHHWDLNDGNQPTDNRNGDSHCITSKTLFSDELPVGQSWSLTVIIAEEDGGNTADLQQGIGKLLQGTGDPYAATAGTILSALTSVGVYLNDSDDWMGMFGVRISNNRGSINVEWNPKEGLAHSIPDPDDRGNSRKREFRMNHDGSNYVGWFGVQ